MKVSRSLVEQFQQTIPVYVKANFVSEDFDGSIWRATKLGGNFHIHPFSNGGFLTTTKLLIPDNQKREQFEASANQARQNKDLVFVLFSSPTMAHAICFVKKL